MRNDVLRRSEESGRLLGRAPESVTAKCALVPIGHATSVQSSADATHTRLIVRSRTYLGYVKSCARCKTSKLFAEFYENKQWVDGHHPYCKRCLLAYQRDRRRERLDREHPGRRRWSSGYVRHEYFSSVDEPIQAYVAGLLAADGNVLERQRRISLELALRDQELVTLVRDELAPGFPVRGRVRASGSATSIFAITSTQMCKDLAKLGITPRKSLTLRWPLHLDRTLARSFLLGYFDGDGFIAQTFNGKYRYQRWGLLGTERFLSSAMCLISGETGISGRRVHRHGGRNVHHLHVNGADALAVDEWLHDGTNLGLARKRLNPDPFSAQADSAATSSS